MPSAKASPCALLFSVGVGGVNRAEDVKAVQARLQYVREQSKFNDVPLRRFAYPGIGGRGEISRMPNGVCDEITIGWIKEFQSHYLKAPDGLISPGGTTNKFLSNWALKDIQSDVKWSGQILKTAWLTLSPLLPEGSVCKSAYRTAEDQKAIIDAFWTGRYATELKQKLGSRYDEISALTGDARYRAMVPQLKAIGQAVAMPGTSRHQFGKAIDIGGPPDAEQIRVVTLVGKAQSTLFNLSQLLLERNGCVHVEIY